MNRTMLVLLLALPAAGCASTEAGFGGPAFGELRVERVQPGGPIADEGTVSFARIERPDGSVVAMEGFDAPDHGADAGTYPEHLELQLDPGSYTILSSQRACDPSCDNLDPPGDAYTCSRQIDVEEGSSLTARVVLKRGECHIELSD